MPMTQAQLDNWFSYHPPTPETAPRYAAIREQQRKCLAAIRVSFDERLGAGEMHTLINEECKAFAIVIDSNAPDCADKSAAIRCVRLARNAFNEAVVVRWEVDAEDMAALVTIGVHELLKARWQANSAIACGGV